MKDWHGVSIHTVSDPPARDAIAEISDYLFQLSPGIGRISKGQKPDSSGDPLVTPVGGNNGQIAYGINNTIAFGTNTKFDNDNTFLGIGTTVPLARIQSNLTTAGTSTRGALGTTMFRASIADTSLLDITPLIFSTSPAVTDIALLGNNAGIEFMDTSVTTAASRMAWTATRSFFQCGRLQSDGSVLNANMTIGGLGATYGTHLGFAFTKFFFDANAAYPQIGVGVGVNPTDFSTWKGVLAIKGASTTEAALNLSPNSDSTGTPPILEVRFISSNTFGSKVMSMEYDTTVGTARLTMWQTDTTRAGYLSKRASEFAGGKVIIQDRNDKRAMSWDSGVLWADSKQTCLIDIGDTTSSHSGALLAGIDAATLDRFAIMTKASMVIDTLPGGAQAAPTAMWHIKGTAADATVIHRIESTRSGQTGNLEEIVSAVASTTNWVINARTVLVTGRIKTAVLFTDDNATIASAKLLGLSVANITAGATRTWTALDLSGNIPIIGDDPPAVAAGSLGKVDLTGQTADIATTNLSNGPPSGDYEVLVYLQCTTADGAAGTLTVTIGWTDTVGATTDTSVTRTLATTGRSTGRILVKRASGEITYAVANGGSYGTAQYAIDVRVLALG